MTDPSIEVMLATIGSLEELSGFIDQLKRPGAKPCSRDQWSKIALKKIKFQEERK